VLFRSIAARCGVKTVRYPFRNEKCVLCGRCVRVCKELFRANAIGFVGRGKDRRVESPFGKLAEFCKRCNTCLEVCPVGAIKRNPVTRAMEVDESRCLGCKTCVMACPFGGVAFDPDRGTAVKCDLCQGRPECAKICPTGAIRYIRDDLVALAKRREAIARLPGYLKAAMPGAAAPGRQE